MKTFGFQPIGYIKGSYEQPYEIPRQGILNTQGAEARVELIEGFNFEQALEDLAGFERIWLLTIFHHNAHWKHKVLPPRGEEVRRGVFATRSPYRPNPIGLTAARLLRIEGRSLYIKEHDLMNETPVLDIKPYLPYADSFPESRVGWLESIDTDAWCVHWEELALTQSSWILQSTAFHIQAIANYQLEYSPLSAERKRLVQVSEFQWVLKLRTWRVYFEAVESRHMISIQKIQSGYSKAELDDPFDKYGDKNIHRLFYARYGKV